MLTKDLLGGEHHHRRNGFGTRQFTEEIPHRSGSTNNRVVPQCESYQYLDSTTNSAVSLMQRTSDTFQGLILHQEHRILSFVFVSFFKHNISKKASKDP